MTEDADLAIVGGGPAGLAAAIEARRAGVRRVVVLDEGAEPGGQIFRRYGKGFTVTDPRRAGHEYRDGQALIDEARASGADIRTRTVVWGAADSTIAYATDERRSGMIRARAIILATGARDRAVPFPGWTMPGVITAGAAKTMVAIQRVLPGRRILMAGSGPLALAFSAQLRAYGANIVEVAEAAPRPGIRHLAGLAAAGSPTILLEAARYRAALLAQRVPFSYSTVIVRVEGRREVERAVVASVDGSWNVVKGTERTLDVDTVLLGYGLEPNAEMSRLLGCRQHFDPAAGGWLPERDAWMRTSVPALYAAGDGAGIAGSRSAVEQGRIAGIAAAAHLAVVTEAAAQALLARPSRRLKKIARFATLLNRIYEPGPGLYRLASPETVVCRCEERRQSDLEALVQSGLTDINAIRAESRIGMGRCQGRNCAALVAATLARLTGKDAVEILPQTPRPPLKPVRIAAIAEERYQQDAAVQVE